MTAKKGFPLELKEWAEDSTFTSPPAMVGTPTKIQPTVSITGEGHLVDRPMAAQWENFFKNVMSQMLVNVAYASMHTWVTPGGAVPNSDSAWVRIPQGPLLAVDPTVNDQYSLWFQTRELAKTTVALAPGSGTWTPEGCNAANDRVVMYGSNSLSTNFIWSTEDRLSDLAERSLTGAVAGNPVFSVRYDSTNDEYFALSTDKKCWTSTDTLTWSAKASFNVTGGNFKLTDAAEGFIAIAADNGAQKQVEYSSDSGTSWTTVNVGAANSEFVIGFGYSAHHEKWLLISDATEVFEADTPAGPWSSVSDKNRSTSSDAWIAGGMIACLFAEDGESENVLHYSLDKGVNWRAVGVNDTGTGDKLWYDGHAFLLHTGTEVYRSLETCNTDFIENVYT